MNNNNNNKNIFIYIDNEDIDLVCANKQKALGCPVPVLCV